MSDKKKFAIACGGTGGHIFPGLATGYELLSRGHDVALWMAGKDIESDAVSEWPGKKVTIPAEGFQFGLSFRSLLTIFRLFKAYRLSLGPMKEDHPHAVLAMGSYASFGPVRAARKLNIPYVLHEANLVPGRAVSLLSRQAHTVAVSFEKSSYYLKHTNIETTGMPLRKELEDAGMGKASRRWNPEQPLRIVVIGGSRGAQVLNETVPASIAAAVSKGVAIEVDHLAGLQNKDSVEAAYAQVGVAARVHPFVPKMEELYLNADLAICRAGAATCAELSVFGVPALLIPYPYAARNHQMSNARALQDSGAADVVAQADLTTSWLRDYLMSVSQKPERLERMSSAMKKRAQVNATARLADLLERVAGA